MWKQGAVAAALFVSACASIPSKVDSLNFLQRFEVYAPLGFVNSPVEGTSHEQWFAPLVGVAEKHGYTVVLSNKLDDEEMWGKTVPREGKIYINTSLGGNGKVAVLAHELGHVFEPRELWGMWQSDIFAESVAYVVCGRLGLDTGQSSATWLRQGGETVKTFLIVYAKQIDETARVIVQEATNGRSPQAR